MRRFALLVSGMLLLAAMVGRAALVRATPPSVTPARAAAEGWRAPGRAGGATRGANADTTTTTTTNAVTNAGATVRVAAVGDLALSWGVGHAIEREGFDPFADVAAVLGAADVAFANLETVLTDRALPAGGADAWPPLIAGPPRAALGVARAGFDVVSVANNHVFDAGAAGLRDTLASLSRAGVAAVGAGPDAAAAQAPFVRVVNGLRVGLLAFTFGTNVPPRCEARAALLSEASAEAVRALRPAVDVLLVSLHWGVEQVNVPRASQVRLAHALVEAGADAIIGHHPHVLQSIEVYRGRPVVYSLGNFVFGPMSAPRQASAVLLLEFARGGERAAVVRAASVVPVRLAGHLGAPLRATDASGEPVRRLLREASVGFGTRFREQGGVLELEL